MTGIREQEAGAKGEWGREGAMGRGRGRGHTRGGGKTGDYLKKHIPGGSPRWTAPHNRDGSRLGSYAGHWHQCQAGLPSLQLRLPELRPPADSGVVDDTEY